MFSAATMCGAGAWVLWTTPPPAPPAPPPEPVVEEPEPPPPPPVPWRLGLAKPSSGSDLDAPTAEVARLLSAQVEKTHHVFEVKVFPDHDALLAALGQKDVDFALLPPTPAWIAHRRTGARVVLGETAPPGATADRVSAAWVNKALATVAKWDHDGDRKTPKKNRICHIVQTRGRISAHASIEDAASVGVPFGTLVADGLLTFEDASRPTDADGLVGAWSSQYLLGQGPNGKPHDAAPSLGETVQPPDADATVRALWYAFGGHADVAFADTMTVSQLGAAEGTSWAADLVAIQVRGDYPRRNAEGEPDCYTIHSEKYRAENPDRFVLGPIPRAAVLAGAHVEDEDGATAVDAIASLTREDAPAEARAAWNTLGGPAALAPATTEAQLGAYGSLLDRLPTTPAPE